MNKILLISPFLMLGLWSCNISSHSESADIASEHYSIADYIDSSFLEFCGFEKIGKIISDRSGRRDTVYIEKEEAQKELSFLKAYDINRSSFYGLYEISSENRGDSLLSRYVAKKDELTVRDMSVLSCEERGVSIELTLGLSSILRTENTVVSIRPCYVKIMRRFRNIFGEEHDISIEYGIFDDNKFVE